MEQNREGSPMRSFFLSWMDSYLPLKFASRIVNEIHTRPLVDTLTWIVVRGSNTRSFIHGRKPNKPFDAGIHPRP